MLDRVREAAGETFRPVAAYRDDLSGLWPRIDWFDKLERIQHFRQPETPVGGRTRPADGRNPSSYPSSTDRKSTPPGDLIGLIRVAADGHTVLSPAATRRLLDTAVDQQAERDERLALIATLTQRERDVLTCLAHGISNADIAGHLHLSPTTVKGHVSRILVKLNCLNRTQAGLLAQHAGHGQKSGG